MSVALLTMKTLNKLIFPAQGSWFIGPLVNLEMAVVVAHGAGVGMGADSYNQQYCCYNQLLDLKAINIKIFLLVPSSIK